MTDFKPKEKQDPKLKVTPDVDASAEGSDLVDRAPSVVPKSSVLRKLDSSNYSRSESFIYSIVGLCVGLFFYALAYSTVFGLPWQSHWLETPGLVTAVKQGVKTKRWVYFSYNVDGQVYSTKQTFEFYGYSVVPGSKITVRYEPGKPTFCVIKTGFNLATILSAIAGTFGFIFCVVFLYEMIFKGSKK